MKKMFKLVLRMPNFAVLLHLTMRTKRDKVPVNQRKKIEASGWNLPVLLSNTGDRMPVRTALVFLDTTFWSSLRP